MPEEQKKHPLEEYSENEQIAYLSVLSAVCYVDIDYRTQFFSNRLKETGIGKTSFKK